MAKECGLNFISIKVGYHGYLVCVLIFVVREDVCRFNIPNSKMVGCAVNVDTSFAQFRNREYRTVNKVTLLNSTYIIPSRTNVNKQLTVK